ncbi:hypothetical protein KY331_02735 [Candidatus Woesearchaeota archaeon]|nr:hypothetical protein [Candidatus Woesearchaeota archaeon]
MQPKPMQRNLECVDCGRKHFSRYAEKLGVKLEDKAIEYAIDMSPDNIRTHAQVLFPLMWHMAGFISAGSYKTIVKTGSTQCLSERELRNILEADPEKEAKKEANERAAEFIKEFDHPPLIHENLKLCALANNLVDNYAGDHRGDTVDIEEILSSEKLLVDDIGIFLGYARGKHVGIIPDNAGEVMFDRLTADILLSNCRVSVVCAQTPRWNDVTYQECQEIFSGMVPVIKSHSVCQYSGEELNRIADEHNIDCWLAKGIVNFESYDGKSEIPVFNFLSLKCKGIQQVFGVDKPEGVITLQPFYDKPPGIYSVRILINPTMYDKRIVPDLLKDIRKTAIEEVEKIPDVKDAVYPIAVCEGEREFLRDSPPTGELVARDYDIYFAVDISKVEKSKVVALGKVMRRRFMDEDYPLQFIDNKR